jgi:sulfite reductase beta subunit-like hemoprotein
VERTAVDRCPGSLALHRAHDGWLARVRLPGGRVQAAQLQALARAAALGSGLVELTSRANLQLRGLAPGAAQELAAIVRAAGLLPSPAHDRARNVIASPVAGRHPHSRAHTDRVVAAIDAGLCADAALAALPGRFSFAVDDGSGLALEPVADVTLIARGERSYVLALAGQATAGDLQPADAAGAAVGAARAFLAEREARGAQAWRIAELQDGAAAVARRVGRRIGGPVATAAARTLGPGRLVQRDGRVAVSALAPLGRLEGPRLAALGRLSGEVRVGTARTVTILDLEPAVAARTEERLMALGLVLRPGSGWAGLTACAGLGRCQKARLDVLAAATARAQSRRPDAPAEHWAACERRCGERQRQPVAVAPAAAGAAILVRVQGRERPVGSLDQALAALGG